MAIRITAVAAGAALLLLLGGCATSQIDAAPETPACTATDVGASETDFSFAGAVSLKSADDPDVWEGIPGVGIDISGEGFAARACTDAEGKWKVYLPSRSTFTLVVDEDGLPEGAAVVDPAFGNGLTQVVEWGLVDTKVINLFLVSGSGAE